MQGAQTGGPPPRAQRRARPDSFRKAHEEGGARVRRACTVPPVVPADDVVGTHLLRVRGRDAVEDAVSHRDVGRREVSEIATVLHITRLLQLRNLEDSVLLHPGKSGYRPCRAQFSFGYPGKLDWWCTVPVT